MISAFLHLELKHRNQCNINNSFIFLKFYEFNNAFKLVLLILNTSILNPVVLILLYTGSKSMENVFSTISSTYSARQSLFQLVLGRANL